MASSSPTAGDSTETGGPFSDKSRGLSWGVANAGLDLPYRIRAASARARNITTSVETGAPPRRLLSSAAAMNA